VVDFAKFMAKTHSYKNSENIHVKKAIQD